MGRKETWAKEELKLAFEKFYKERGHYPTAIEVDECKYLPSARQFQRRFGGLTKFRALIGLTDIHFGIGKYRSRIGNRVGKRGSEAEQELEKILIGRFGEAFVHIEKPINPQIRRIRYDFFIYAKNFIFAVDIFYSDTKRLTKINLDLKLDSYIKTFTPLFLVMANPDITQEDLDDIVKHKPNKPLPSHIKLLTLNNFLALIEQFQALEIKN